VYQAIFAKDAPHAAGTRQYRTAHQRAGRLRFIRLSWRPTIGATIGSPSALG
jgi:hypothetical protein